MILHIFSKLARCLSEATLYIIYWCVKHPGSGFFFSSQCENSRGRRYSKRSSICRLAFFSPVETKLQVINPLLLVCTWVRQKSNIGRHCTDVRMTRVAFYLPPNWHCKRSPPFLRQHTQSKRVVPNDAPKEIYKHKVTLMNEMIIK